MRHTTRYARPLVGALGFILLFCSPASAQFGEPPCKFDTTPKAKSAKVHLVRAFSACGGSTTFPSPNTENSLNTDACVPPTPMSIFQFGPKGDCSFKSQLKSVFDQPIDGGKKNACFPDDSVASCAIITASVKCRDIRNEDGTLIDEDSLLDEGDWGFEVKFRATGNERANDRALTFIDFPLNWRFPPAKKGQLKGKFSAHEALFKLLGFGSAPSPCAQFEILDVLIRNRSDANYGIFARQGLSASYGN